MPWADNYSNLVEEADEVEERLEELRDAAAAVDGSLDAFSRLLVAASAEGNPQAAIAKTLVEAATAGNAAQRANREFRLELSGEELIPPSELAALRAEADEHTRRLERLFGTLTFLRTTRQREALLVGGAAGGAADGASPSDLIALGMKVQVESQEAVSRMTRMVESTREVGAATLGSLAAQHTKLDGINAAITAQVYQYAEAEKAMTEYVSDAINDNLTLLLLMLIFVALVVVGVCRLTGLEPTGEGSRLYPGAHADVRGWSSELYPALDLRVDL